jgi:hypothetical protein
MYNGTLSYANLSALGQCVKERAMRMPTSMGAPFPLPLPAIPATRADLIRILDFDGHKENFPPIAPCFPLFNVFEYDIAHEVCIDMGQCRFNLFFACAYNLHAYLQAS